MALKPCPECGNQVSTNVAACPQCGSRPKKPTSLLTKVIASAFAISIGISIIAANSGDSENKSSTAAKRPADPKKEAAFQKTVAVVRSIKASLRDPTSVQWEAILRNEDATVVCVVYRARNGFGGMNVEQVAYANKKLSTSGTVWNKHCANKSLIDERKIRIVV